MDLRIKFEIIPSFAESLKVFLNYTNDKWVLKQKYSSDLYFNKDKEIIIPTDIVENELIKLVDVTISPIPLFIMGLEGTSYKLEIINGLNSVTYKWWAFIPVEFKPLALFAKELLNWGDIHIESFDKSFSDLLNTTKTDK